LKPLTHSCFLYSSCEEINRECQDCKYGTKVCEEDSAYFCKVPKSNGGHYFCQKNNTESGAVFEQANLSYCYHKCEASLNVRQCLNGRWTGPEPSCECPSAPAGSGLMCSTTPNKQDTKGYEGGTVCSKTCSENFMGSTQRVYGTTTCRDKHWDNDLSDIDCDSLSTLAIILISVGSALVVGLLAGGLIFYCIRRIRDNREMGHLGEFSRNIDHFNLGTEEPENVRTNKMSDRDRTIPDKASRSFQGEDRMVQTQEARVDGRWDHRFEGGRSRMEGGGRGMEGEGRRVEEGRRREDSGYPRVLKVDHYPGGRKYNPDRLRYTDMLQTNPPSINA